MASGATSYNTRVHLGLVVHPAIAAIPGIATAVLVALAVAWSPSVCGAGITGLTLLLIGVAGLTLALTLALVRFLLTAAAVAGIATILVIVGFALAHSSGCF